MERVAHKYKQLVVKRQLIIRMKSGCAIGIDNLPSV